MLGGGLAYRFFFWVLAITVLLAGGLGLASASGADVAGDSRGAGMTTALASTIANAAEQSESGRWWLVLTGIVLFLWFSYGLLRALHLVHAAAWRIAPPPLRNLPRAVGFVVAAPIVLLAATGTAGWVRTHAANPVGLLATLAVGVGFGVVWLWVSMHLPVEGRPLDRVPSGRRFPRTRTRGAARLHDLLPRDQACERLRPLRRARARHDRALLPLPRRPRRRLGGGAERGRLGGALAQEIAGSARTTVATKGAKRCRSTKRHGNRRSPAG